jgi:hypothetical protein
MPKDSARKGHHLPIGRPRTLLLLSVLVMASALPPVQVDPGSQFDVLVEGAPPEAEAAMDNGEEARAEGAKTANRSGAEAEHLKAGLAEAKEQLSQATAAAIKLERARGRASNEANMLRGEAELARQELSLALAEIRHLKAANAKLEKQVVSLLADARSATELTGQTRKLPNLPDLAGSEGAYLPRKPHAMPDPVEYEAPAVVTLSSAITQPTAPERAAEIGSGQPTADSPELPMVSSEDATLETGSGLANFHASIEALNDLERGGTGTDLFSNVEAVSGRAVHINATPAWDTLPPIAKQTYLDMLLDNWVAARGGKGPAVVRIVDQSGQVLIEKSSP